MSDQPRDWDKEMADIDRAIEKQGGPPPAEGGRPPALPPGTAPAVRPAPTAPAGARSSVALTWFWVVLALLLAVALPLWPYGKQCGLQLFFYLGATVLALLAGAIGALTSWATRRGLAHVLALLVLTGTAVMAAREVLPRIGYAAEAKTWLCPTTPEPAPPARQPQPTEPAPAPPTS
jgi:hypothetical protein